MQQKIIWIPLLIIGVLISFLLQGCGQEDVENISVKVYLYNNQTKYSIIIHKWLNNFEDIYELPKASQIEFKNEFNGGGCFIDNTPQTSFNPSYDCLLINADSVEIIFDSSKSYWLKRSDQNSVNILDKVNYYYTKQDNRDNYLYNFTEIDYQNAIEKIDSKK